jgi:peptidyl-prolyl cis-trans isomerase SurA
VRQLFYATAVSLLLFCPAVPATAAGEKDFTVAAVVGDHVITRYDVSQRIRFIIATTGIKPDPATLNTLFPRVMNTLIDEQLQRQEASRANIDVPQEEVDAATARIETESKRPTGSLQAFLTQVGIDKATLDAQLRAQIGWGKLMQKRIIPTLQINNQEMSRAIEQTMQSENRVDEVKVASLILANSAATDDVKTKGLAESIVKDLRAGASFEAVARQLTAPQLTTISPTWVPVRQLSKDVAARIARLTPPAISDPVQVPSGYQILLLQERRSVVFDTNAEGVFKEIILNLPANAGKKDVDVLMAIARDVRKNAGTCANKNIAGVEDLAGLDFKVDYTRTNFNEISPQVSPLVRALKVGETSEPFATPEGIRLLQLCEKTVLPAKAPERDKLEQKLKAEKFTLESLRALRDLRRDAYIDIRI